MNHEDRIIQAMRWQFGADRQRIDHALQVLMRAKQIMKSEGGNRNVVFAAAILHDIGIQEAERKHGSSAPRYQELEGPPIARRILDRLQILNADEIGHVCRIVGSHHSGCDVDSLEFRIVWDADWLVNFRDVYPCEFGVDCKTRGHQCKKRFNKIFRTASGRELADAALLPAFGDNMAP